jgi:hypothetical protein
VSSSERRLDLQSWSKSAERRPGANRTQRLSAKRV